MRVGYWQHVAVIVDAGPRVISYVIDGEFNDGGSARQYGWGRFDPQLGELNGDRPGLVGPKLVGELGSFRIYGRYLRVSEAVGNFRAGMA